MDFQYLQYQKVLKEGQVNRKGNEKIDVVSDWSSNKLFPSSNLYL